MNKNHPCPSFPHFIHGADYNPEQWMDPAIWDRDMELMKQAHCNEMTVGIFSWAVLEPREGEYDFSVLDETIRRVRENGGKVILSTPSGARPHWLSDKYPEVLRVRPNGVREHFRGRHNHCFTSPVYREKVRTINRLLAERYGQDPTVIAWHISNEYSGECHCPLCVNAFRDFLREKYGNDISRVNQAWWTTFWSHTYTDFDQIEPPGPLTENAVHGLNLDWHRFVTHQTTDFIRNEIAPLRELTPEIPVTINMMYEFYELDYRKVADVIDFASWDCYPEWHNGDDAVIAQRAAFWHDLYRSLKGKPFLLMESTPSLVNWKPYNKPKRPGLDVLSSMQAIAHGSDSVQYFQWRKGRGSSEKLHGAVVGHDGTADTRVFRSVATTGKLLEKLDQIAGTRVDAPAAVIFDWENMWALDDCQGYASNKKYFDTCYEYHRILWQRGINCDIVSPHADLSRYKLVFAPMLYLTDKAAIENLTEYVRCGGTLWATYMLGTVNETDLCWLGGIPAEELKEVFGIEAEEIDTLYPAEQRRIQLNGAAHTAVDYCEVLKLQGATVLAEYADDWYAGLAAVTEHPFGKGRAIYQACRDTGSLKDALADRLLAELGIQGPAVGPLPHGVTAHSRTDEETDYIFLENYTTEAYRVTLAQPMEDLLRGGITEEVTLEPYGLGVFARRKENSHG